MNNFNQHLSVRQRKNAVEAFIKLKSELFDYKNKVICEESAMVERILKFNIETLKALQTYSKNLDEIIKEILNWKSIDQPKLNKSAQTLLTLPRIDLPQFKKIFLPEPYKNTMNIILPKNLDPWNQLDFEEKSKRFKLYSLKFLTSKKTISTFDAKRVKITESEILDYQLLVNVTAECLLPDGKLFFLAKNKCMILYPFNYLRFLPTYKPDISIACATYIDGFVYLFGDQPKRSAKLNINDERWINFPAIPLELKRDASCAQFKNYILLCSWESTNFFYYDILVNSYSEMPLNGLWKVPKAILVKNDKAFLLEFSRFIYECDESVMAWNKIGGCTELHISNPLISHSIEYKGKFYFASSLGVYSFDLKAKFIEHCGF